MSKGVWRPFLLTFGVFVLCSAAHARAGEFCPAKISQIFSVSGHSNEFAVRLTAMSPRNVTGQFLIETNRGWYRAPFPPMQVKTPVYVSLSGSAAIANVWLAQAASDDPLWGPRGVVACAPEPERRMPASTIQPAQGAHVVAALTTPAPFTYHCAAPFAPPKADNNVINDDDYAPGQYAAAIVDLDVTGKVIDVVGIDASGDDFTLRKKLENSVRHMRFTPGVAYCKPVPSSGILSQMLLPY